MAVVVGDGVLVAIRQLLDTVLLGLPGLVVKAALDTNRYPTKTKVTDEQLERLRLKRHEFHGEWNYTLSPRR